MSRTKLELFVNCPRCFYLDRRLGIPQPPGFPFSLNSAVDALLKREFDQHRAAGTAHPLMREYGIDAVPFPHPELEAWRDARTRGVRYHHAPTNFLVTGGIDDLWVNPKGELHVVDYKATAKNSAVSIDQEWQAGYRRQVEVYQWLLRGNGLNVSDTAYFVYCNGNLEQPSFGGKLEFAMTILRYAGSDAWIEPTLAAARACLERDELPAPALSCDFCRYRAATREFERG